MADKSGIQWTDATWNPTTGCDRVSPGCANCYALTLAPRLQAMAQKRAPTDPYMRDGDPKTSGPGFGLMMHAGRLDQPLRWKRPRRIFTNSMSDLFHPDVTDEFLDRVFAVMALAPQHTFQVLTKRPERMRAYLMDEDANGMAGRMNAVVATADQLYREYHETGSLAPLAGTEWPLRNVWLGTSVENARWRTRIDELRETPAAVRFLSCEPLLGPLVPPNWHYDDRGNHWLGNVWHDFPHERGQHAEDCAPLDLTGIDWVIIGGESGPGARPMDEQWVRDIVAECLRQGAKPFVKQMGETWSREHLGHGGHGGKIETFPEDLQVREYPDAH